MDRRVMVVAYNFPPVVGTGIERTLKHVTYLPDHRWRPVVVAPANPAYRLVDQASVALIPPGTEVHRAPTLEPAHARLLLRKMLRGEAPPGESTPGAASDAASRGEAATSGLRGLVNAAWARIIPTLFFPDEQLLWAPSAAVVGWRTHRRHPVDVLYSSAPPFSTHLGASLLQRQIGVPWVADFRDPWIGNSFARPLGAPHRRMQAAVERWIVSRANRSIFASERMRERYATRYPALADRFVVIPNGYDLGDLASARASAAAKASADDGLFHLVYAGSLYGADELALLLDGVELLRQRRPELANRLRVELIGWLNAENQALAASRLPRLEPIVRHVDFMPRNEALARVAGADAGLLLMADAPMRDQVVGSKLYEYIGLDKPVLAVTPPGEARRTLEGLDWGVLADPEPERVADGLERIMAAGGSDRIADPERMYERQTLAAALAALLDEVASELGGG
jgi:glycosyltransferase involved in cell wall biosynthesis